MQRALLILFIVAAGVYGQVLVVEGLGGKTVALTLDDLAKLPHKTLDITDHDKAARFEVVAIADVLAKVDLPLGDKFHLTGAAYYLVAEARDGYRVVFSWAELDSSYMDKAIYVATARDGKPLPARDGPFQLVVPGEKRNGRWARQVVALRLRRAN